MTIFLNEITKDVLVNDQSLVKADEDNFLFAFFSIEDNGGCIDKDIYENIFDPFITSKKDGKGLGLSIVSKIIQDHDGVIECAATSKGTIMSILFPVSH